MSGSQQAGFTRAERISGVAEALILFAQRLRGEPGAGQALINTLADIKATRDAVERRSAMIPNLGRLAQALAELEAAIVFSAAPRSVGGVRP